MVKIKGILILAIVALFSVIGYSVWDLFFKSHFQAQAIISEIEEFEIDSMSYYQYSFDSSITMREFWLGGKYKIDVTTTHPKPFYSLGRQELVVKNVEGDYVIIYDTEYHYPSHVWKVDFIRLMRKLDIQYW